MRKAKTTESGDGQLPGGVPAPTAPAPGRLLAAAAVALVGSLVLDAALVALAEVVFPGLHGFSHFRFADYGSLTALGVLAASAAWPVVQRATSEPRRLLLRLALVVSAVLFLPDVVLLLRHEPARGVATLMAMHLAVAVVTYNALVRIAPGDRVGGEKVGAGQRGVFGVRGGGLGGVLFSAMAGAVFLELVLGAVLVLVVPAKRPNGLDPRDLGALYDLHGVLGGLICCGAVVSSLASLSTGVRRAHAVAGTIALLVAALGGLLTAEHNLRLAGMALMLLGGCAAALAFALAAIEPSVGASPSPGGRDTPLPRSPVPRDELGRELDQWGHPREPWGKGTRS